MKKMLSVYKSDDYVIVVNRCGDISLQLINYCDPIIGMSLDGFRNNGANTLQYIINYNKRDNSESDSVGINSDIKSCMTKMFRLKNENELKSKLTYFDIETLNQGYLVGVKKRDDNENMKTLKQIKLRTVNDLCEYILFN